MRGGNRNPTENNRGKQGMSVHTPAKRLLGDGPQTPEKARQRRPFHRPLRAAARPADASKHEGHTFFQPVKSPVFSARKGAGHWRDTPLALGLRAVAAPPVERLARQQSGPCRGIGGGPQQADFTGFRQGENRENRQVCTTLHCLPLLRADKREVRIIPNRAHLNQSY